ncbi:MAG: DUF853 family protein [Alphaproteobacteria bacterium]|nr:DUF853 family protein [Alphaproteobacteria bacterium]
MGETTTAQNAILVGRGDQPVWLNLSRANRHGLIAGATGTGKTVTLQVLAEGFAAAGVPVFCADIKGDLSGISQPGKPNPKLEQRAAAVGLADFAYRPTPAVFWDVFGEQGHPIRATVAEMGPVLLGRMLDLNEVQEGVLNVAFKLADDEGLLLLDYKDLRALLVYVAERADALATQYGNVSEATIGTIQRKLLALEQAGGEPFFGEPALELADLLLVTPDGRGAVNVLAADKLIASPRLYATFLLWLLSELFEELPEVGDLDKPKLVFFFDEAHLLFKDAPKPLVEKITQVVRLIRSKGVGVYLVTQNPVDVPPDVLGQLGNRVQHALRAFTPVEQRAVRAAAETFRANPKFKVERAITELAVGEALVSTLGPGGVPGVVERAMICPPRSRIGAITPEERAKNIAASPIGAKYDTPVDRESAYERLQGRATTVTADPVPTSPWREAAAPVREDDPWGTGARPNPAGSGYVQPYSPPRRRRQPAAPSAGGLLGELLGGHGGRQGAGEAMVKSIARSFGSQVGGQVGRAILRGVLGSILKR